MVPELSSNWTRKQKSPNFYYVTAALYGIATVDSKRIPWLGTLQKTVLILIALVETSAFIYHSVAIFNGNFVLVKIVRLLMCIISAKILIDCNSDRPHLSYITFLKFVSSKENALLSKYLNIHFIIVTIIGVLSSGLLMYHSITFGWKEVNLLFGAEADPTIYEAVLSMGNYQFLYFVQILAAEYYNSIQYICYVYAETCKELFESFDETNYELFVKIKCQEFNQLRTVINETLGFIPFALMIYIWLLFVIGMSFVLSRKDDFTIFFSGVVFSSSLGLLILSLMETLYYVNKSDSSMKEARRVAATRVTNRMASAKYHFSEMNRYFALLCYLKHNPVVKMNAFCVVDLEPQVLLSIGNSLITFIILLLTTLKDFLS